jgi:ketosteroid isomerase-like protein
VNVAEAARRWADVWTRAWPAHDVDAIVELYAEDALFRSAPFRDRSRGREGVRGYVEWALAQEERSEARFGRPMVAGDRAVVEYWAVIEERETGKVESLAGASLLRFGEDGLVLEQHDYWHMEEGRREPPAEWGR